MSHTTSQRVIVLPKRRDGDTSINILEPGYNNSRALSRRQSYTVEMKWFLCTNINKWINNKRHWCVFMTSIPATLTLLRCTRSFCLMSRRTSYPNSNREDNTWSKCAIIRAKHHFYTKVTHTHWLHSCSQEFPYKKETLKTKGVLIDTLVPTLSVSRLSSQDPRSYLWVKAMMHLTSTLLI